MNSLMSMRTIAFSSSKRNSASALHSSVLPTPVGPRKRNEPIGRFGSPRPARGGGERERDAGRRVGPPGAGGVAAARARDGGGGFFLPNPALAEPLFHLD